ncbi:MAG TPA: 5'-3' exonuclease [Actinomycetota bacterium]|nr:5'-3' exonuclease [Actinomycetota bacterium]
MTSTLLLDTSSLMYRAFFSVPPTVTNAEGQPINAMHGYLDMVSRLIADRRPDRTVHVYDEDWRPAPRVKLYEGYKAQRKPDPEGLPEQFVILRSVLDALGMPQAEAEGWEAEDAIGALAARVKGTDRAEIVTGDRDLIQLVRDPHVRVLFTVRGVSELRILDEGGVLKHYGVPANRYAEFAILRGDPSDGLPGVHGVGEKTARALIEAYPTLDALLADAAAERRTGRPLQRSASLRGAVREATDYVRAMQEVVRIRTESDVRTWQAEPDQEAADALAERYRLTGPVRRLREALGGESG